MATPTSLLLSGLMAVPVPALVNDFAGGCVRIEFVSREEFIGCCLGLRWSRETGQSADTWDGIMRRKWIGAALAQTQYEATDVPDIIPPDVLRGIRANLARFNRRPRCRSRKKKK